MLKTALAGALALVAIGTSPASAQDTDTATQQMVSRSAAAFVEGRIASAKAMLRLRTDQERYWPRIASAIRAYANAAGGGQQPSAIKAAAAQAIHAHRIVAAAAPLVKVLDADQRQTALALIRSIGFGHLAATM